LNKIILAGGTGLIGNYLRQSFEEKGYDYTILTRNPKKGEEAHYAYWDPDQEILDAKILEGAKFIINLSGANVGKGRWTEQRKKDILNSRINSTKLLYKAVSSLKKKPKAYISASAIGYYGLEETPIIHTESEAPASDFLGKVCSQWEREAMKFHKLGVRTTIFRTGLVLAKEASAWKMMKLPIQLGLGASLGSGKQIIPWIHITDVVKLYHYAMFNKDVKGVYNAVSPDYSSMNIFNKTLAKELKRPYFLPPIPKFIIQLLMGKKALLVLNGNRISSEKIQAEGFHFKYTYLEKTFNDLLS
jgi:uncharacterized protein (TIGR01777 family)